MKKETDKKISEYFSKLGKKGWEAKKKKILEGRVGNKEKQNELS